MRKTDKIPFWKCVGGYTTCVKWRNRWYYVGRTGSDAVEFHRQAKEAGVSLIRVIGRPKALEHGTVAELRKRLPAWPGFKTVMGDKEEKALSVVTDMGRDYQLRNPSTNEVIGVLYRYAIWGHDPHGPPGMGKKQIVDIASSLETLLENNMISRDAVVVVPFDFGAFARSVEGKSK